jgi:hypothetical protein
MSTTLTLRVLATLAFSCLAACNQEIRGGEAVRTETYVLVDLSRTWFTPEHEPKNRALLTAVGQGAGLMATEVETPYLVQYRAIGDQSYLREPICSVVYTPGFRRKGASKDSVSRPGNVASYLTHNCVDGILRRQPEDLTQISAAVASIAVEPRPTAKGVRSIIIISDFLEETFTAAPIPDGSLDGVRVLLLYRPLSGDQYSPSGTGARVNQWRERLASKGATVQLAPDTSMRASQIVSFLNQ